MVRRVEPGARISFRRGNRGGRLVAVLREVAGAGEHPPADFDHHRAVCGRRGHSPHRHYGRHPEPARSAHHRARHGHLLCRHPAVDAVQRRRGGNQGHGRSARHRIRRVLRERQQLGSLHSAQHRHVRRVRLVRHRARLGHHLLRLHRLRRGLHRGPGSEESVARHAHRHPRQPDHLHAAVYPDVGCADGLIPYPSSTTQPRSRSPCRLTRASTGSRRSSWSVPSPVSLP